MQKLLLIFMFTVNIIYSNEETNLMEFQEDKLVLEKEKKEELFYNYHLASTPSLYVGGSIGSKYKKREVNLAFIYKTPKEYHFEEWHGLGFSHYLPNTSDIPTNIIYLQSSFGSHMGIVGNYMRFKLGISNDKNLYFASEYVISVFLINVAVGIDFFGDERVEVNEKYTPNYYLTLALGL